MASSLAYALYIIGVNKLPFKISTALLIGIFVFGESFSLRMGIGIVLILCAVTLIVLGKSLNIKKIGSAIYYDSIPKSVSG